MTSIGPVGCYGEHQSALITVSAQLSIAADVSDITKPYGLASCPRVLCSGTVQGPLKLNFVNHQLAGFLDVYSILSGMQSGFRSSYGCVTSTLKVLNDVPIALVSMQCCAAILTWPKLLIW